MLRPDASMIRFSEAMPDGTLSQEVIHEALRPKLGA